MQKPDKVPPLEPDEIALGIACGAIGAIFVQIVEYLLSIIF